MTALLAEPIEAERRIVKINGHAQKIAPGFKFKFHPLAENFPRLPREELDLLVEEIKRAGIAPPILIHDDLIIGDRNQAIACGMAGIELEFRKWDGFGSIAETIARGNIPRLHLSDSQRAAVAVPIADSISEENSSHRVKGLKRGNNPLKTAIPAKSPVSLNLGSRGISGEDYKKSTQKAAELCHVSRAYVELAKSVRDFSPAVFDQVRLGKLNLHQASAEISRIRKRNTIEIDLAPVKSVKTDELVICADCLKILPAIQDERFALGIWDPHYNNRYVYDNDPSGDQLSDRDYLAFIERVGRHLHRILGSNGSLFVIIDWRYCCDFGVLFKNIGFHLRMLICWDDRFPQERMDNFPNAGRFVLYLTKSAKNFVWHPDRILIPTWRAENDDKRRTKDEGLPTNVWPIPRVTGNSSERVPFKKAPPQIPDALLRRCILAASEPGDEIIDPTCGNGTTGKAAIALGRKFLGIERSPLYAEQARKWISSAAVPAAGEENSKKR